MGWVGTYQKWFDTLDLMEQLAPEVIVPGHGPVCGLEGVRELRSYLQHLHTESRKYFDAGLSATEAAKRIEIGPYADWHAPARVYMNVERAYREFRNEPPNTPWDHAKVFDSVYMVAKAKGVPVEY
jgi:cyclase